MLSGVCVSGTVEGPKIERGGGGAVLVSNEKAFLKKQVLSRTGGLQARFLYSSFLLPEKSKENRLKIWLSYQTKQYYSFLLTP
jgi:hypothetical protein